METVTEKEKVIIFDTTLRDGEQSPGISLDIDEKVTIAEQLGVLGVDVIEAGFPVASNGDFEAVRAVAETFSGNREIVVCGLSRTALGDIDRCWEAIEPAENKRIHTFIATSDIHMEKKLKMTPQQVIDEAARAVAHAKQYTHDVEFSPEDASRSDFDFMCRVLQTAVDNGATTLNIPDTVGFAQPNEYAERLRKVRETVKGSYVISTHCHNDLGLAVANTIAGISAGARQVEVAVNGIGERAGNAALEEVVMNLTARQDHFGNVYTNVNTTELYETSKLVSRLTGYVVQRNKAVVGSNAFAHESGIHQHGVMQARETYEHIDPAMVGQTSSIEIGKLSGRAAITSRMQVMGIQYHDVQAVTKAMKQVADTQKRSVADVEIENIFAQLAEVELHDTAQINHISTQSADDQARASITITFGGEVMELVEINGGEIGAAEKAINKVFPGYRMFDYVSAEAANEHGASATGSAYFKVSTPTGEVITTYAEDKNVTHAAIKAFVRAVNCGERIRQRKLDQQGVEE